jgi:hypothetical protein
MPIDWDQLEKDLDSTIEDSAKRTDAKLASKISSITRLTNDEIIELFPEPADVVKLAALMKIVKEADDRNTKINNIVAKSEEFAGVILTLLEKFA